jgi:hypothetical protein
VQDISDELNGPEQPKPSRAFGNLDAKDLQHLTLFGDERSSSAWPWPTGSHLSPEARQVALRTLSSVSIVVMVDGQLSRMIGMGKKAFTVGTGPWQGITADVTLTAQEIPTPFLIRVERVNDGVEVTNLGPPGGVCLIDQDGASGPLLAPGDHGLAPTGTMAVAGVKLRVVPLAKWFDRSVVPE